MNTHNPYAAPRAPDSYAPPAAGGKISIERAIGDAWRIATANIGVLVGGFLVSLVAAIIAEITLIGIFLALPVLAWGVTRFYLNMVDGRADISDIFSGFKDYVPVLKPMLILFLIGLGAGIALVVLSLIPFLGILIYFAGIITFCVVGTYVGFIMVDQRREPMDAIRQSIDVVKPQAANVVGLMFLSGLIGCAGLLALGLGALFTFPLAGLISTCAYRQMYPANAGAAPAGGGGGVRLDK